MELTKENYYETESMILNDIEKSEFISFDLELSGLCEQKQKLLDSPEDRFKKMRYVAENYRIIQLGLVTFIPNNIEKEEQNENRNYSYIVKPYCIYVFPSEKQSNGRFDFDSKAIIFNKNHGIDFNKWIYDGVSYLNGENLNKLTERLLSGNINKYNPKDKSSFKYISLYKEIDRNRYNNFIKEFNKFYYESKEKVFKYEKMMKHLVLYFLNKCDDQILSTIYIEYKDEIIGDNIKSYMYFYKLNTFEEKIQKIIQEDNNAIHIIKREKGVKNLIEKIIGSHKPIVGHNCFVDLLFIMSHFIDEIPREYKTFKLMLTNIFNAGIYDTKFLFSNSELEFDEKILEIMDDKEKPKNKTKKINKSNYHLENLFHYLYIINKNNNKAKFTIPDDGKFENYLNFDKPDYSSKYHNADFDALTTGCCYVYLRTLLGEQYIKEQVNKLNFCFGIYSSFDLNSDSVDEKYLKNCTDVYIVTFTKKQMDKETMNKIDSLLRGKYVATNLEGVIERNNSVILFINSENKNDFINECSTLNEYILVKTLKEVKESLDNENNNYHNNKIKQKK